jgi:hypothetical protein
VHGGRSAYKHLLCLAQTNGIPRSRVDEVIGLVGLEDVAGTCTAGSRSAGRSASASSAYATSRNRSWLNLAVLARTVGSRNPGRTWHCTVAR